jgi:hypothetical protein
MPIAYGAATVAASDGDPCRLLDLPRPLLTAIALRCSDPTSLFASCPTLNALGADPAVELGWFLRHRPRPRILPYAAAGFHRLAGRPFEDFFAFTRRALAAAAPGACDAAYERGMRKAERLVIGCARACGSMRRWRASARAASLHDLLRTKCRWHACACARHQSLACITSLRRQGRARRLPFAGCAGACGQSQDGLRRAAGSLRCRGRQRRDRTAGHEHALSIVQDRDTERRRRLDRQP